MKIVSLLENTTERDGMKTEHGLSLYIESGDRKILFDMGQTELFYENAKTLGIDLSSVDIAIISHGHYDHGGGLRKFLEINSKAPVYIHKDAFLPHYNGKEKYIGLDILLENNCRIIYTEDSLKLDKNLALYTCNKEKRRDMPPHTLNEKTGDVFITDDFRHEQYLVIEENGKRVLISGCSHKGILDIAKWFAPDVLIGGFHFSKLPLDGFLLNSALELDTYPTEFYTCHCTGVTQYEFMRGHMKRLKYLFCGAEIEI